MKRAVVYLRVSTDRQGGSGLGIDAQREAVSQYLNGAPILQEFVEVESGRRHKNRPKLLAALEQCKKQRATLIIAKLDRLGRNVAFISALMESGVDFICCDNPHANRLMLHMLAAFAEHERELISARTREAMQRAKAYLSQHGSRTSLKGRVYTKLGNPRIEEARFASQMKADKLKPPQEVLSLITRVRLQAATYRAIADYLNAQNIRTPRGYRWYASTVRAVLSRYDETTKTREDGNTMGRHNESTITTSHLPIPINPATSSFAVSSAGRETAQEGGDMAAIDEAQRMLDVFASVGARSFILTRFDIEKNLKWGKSYTGPELREKLPTIMRLAAMRYPYTLQDGRTLETGDNLAIRPTGPDINFFQLDDLKEPQLDRLKQAAFLMHETSPGNYQAWIAVSGLPDDKEAVKSFMRRIRKAVGGNDKSASGSTRLAGTENFKPAYAPEYPVVSITHYCPGRLLTEKELAQMGLLASPEPIKMPPTFVNQSPANRPWPSYEICLQRAPRKPDGSPDRSKADFAFALTSLTGKHGVEETIAKLAEVSDRVKERLRSDPGYARVTVENAERCVAQNYGKSRSRA